MTLTNAGFPCPPLTYVGGKAQFANRLAALFPYAPPVMVSPLIGGGSVECAMALRGVRVHGYDANPNLVGFWQMLLLDNPAALMDDVLDVFGHGPLTACIAQCKSGLKKVAANAVHERAFRGDDAGD